jgi:hypothetical protein
MADHDTPSRGSPPGTPRWVRASGLAALVLLFLFVTLHLTGIVGMGGHR